MGNYDLKSPKYILAITVICIVFLGLVVNAYKYLPNAENNSEQIEYTNNQRERYDANNTSYNNNEYVESREEIDNNRHKKGMINYDINGNPISVSNSNNETITNSANSYNQNDNNNYVDISEKTDDTNNLFQKAKDLANDKKYESAVYEYQQIAEKTTNNEIKADCYSEIAKIYSTIKRYTPALTYAKKSYNIAPNEERELLLSRIYYQTGDIDSATKILKKDIQIENNK